MASFYGNHTLTATTSLHFVVYSFEPKGTC